MSVNEEKTKGNRSGIANYKKILENNPKSFIFAKLAEEHLKLGEVDKAVEVCRVGLQHNPEFADGLYVMGVALFKKGEREAAETMFLRILKANSEHYMAMEALRRLGNTDEQIAEKAAAFSLPLELTADEDEISPLKEKTTQPIRRTQPSEMQAERSARRARTGKEAVLIARRQPGEAHENEEDEVDEKAKKKRLPLWLRIAVPVGIALLAVIGYFGFQAYINHQNEIKMEELVSKVSEDSAADTFAAYSKAVEDLESGLKRYGNSRKARTLLVQFYARLLLDFAPENLNWQDRMEQVFTSLPQQVYDDADILTARGWRAFAQNKPGDLRFILDTATEKKLMNDDLLCLEAELNLYDRKFDTAISFFKRIIEKNPRMVRPVYKKGLAEIEAGDKSAGTEDLAKTIKNNPDHLGARLALFEVELDKGIENSPVHDEIESFWNKFGESLPSIPRARLNYLKGRLALEAGRDKDALVYAEEAVKLNARTEHRYLLADCQFRMGKFEEARQVLLPAIQKQPENKKYLLLLARILLALGNRTGAVEQFELAIDDSTSDVNILVAAGDAALQMHMFDKASSYYEKAVFSDLGNMDLLKKLILTQIEKRDLTEARKRITQLLVENPQSAQAHYLNGKLLLASEEDEEAIKAFNKGAELNPEDLDIQLELARYDLSHSKPQEGIARLRKLHETQPDLISVSELLLDYALACESWDEAGEILNNLQNQSPAIEREAQLMLVDYMKCNKDKARQALTTLKEHNQQNGMVRLVDGIFLISEGDYKKADLEFKEIIQLAGQLPLTHYWYGRLKLAQDERVWARSEFEQALRIQADYPRALYEIGQMLFVDGKIEQAVKLFNQSLALLEQFPRAVRYRSRIYSRLGEVDMYKGRQAAGIKRFKAANQLNPNDPEPYYLLAREGDKYNNPSKALQLLDKALKIDPDYAVAHFEKGFILQNTGRGQDAVVEFENYLRLAPNGEYSNSATKELAKLKEGSK